MISIKSSFALLKLGQSDEAKRAGITDIIICEENRRDIEAIPEMYVEGLTFHYVNDIKQVLDIALLDEKVTNAINLSV